MAPGPGPSGPGQSSDPRHPDAHLVDCGGGSFALFDVGRSRVSNIGGDLAGMLEHCLEHGDVLRAGILMEAAGLGTGPVANPAPPAQVKVKTFSLSVAQKCNLGCVYCYAQNGSFGGPAKSMPADVARAAVDRLLADSLPGEKVNLVFLGGEPLANRATLREVTLYAVEEGRRLGIEVGFAITTNATLIDEADATFFEEFRFTVTVSIDGPGAVHDRLRPLKSGAASYDRVRRGAKLLLGRDQQKLAVNARVTVTPLNLDLSTTLLELAAMGFHGIQFSPMLSSPTGAGAMDAPSLKRLLNELVACGRIVEEELAKGRCIPLSNFFSTLQKLHHGGRDDYPCGAGGSYLGVSAEGNLYACHRFVEDQPALMGNIAEGVDAGKQAGWLESRHLRAQPACQSCWARHLCGGSCHYEVIKRGRPACDFIRGWLHYCLGAYVRLMRLNPAVLEQVIGKTSGTARVEER